MAPEKHTPAATANNPQPFDVTRFVAQSHRTVSRLVMAAYGVGATHAWFRAAPRHEQVEKVREWVEAALESAADRRAALSVEREEKSPGSSRAPGARREGSDHA